MKKLDMLNEKLVELYVMYKHSMITLVQLNQIRGEIKL